jgi:multidrug efflux pump subunit AcrA (membrane-fusion protein)
MSETNERIALEVDESFDEDVAEEPERDSAAGTIVRTLAVLLVVAVTAAISVYWMMNRPKANRRPPKPRSVRVTVKAVSPQAETVVVSAMGTVVPAREIQLAARVGGEIIDVHPNFVPGGRFKVGGTLVQVDPKDYDLAISRREAELKKAEADVEQRTGDMIQRKTAVTRADTDLAIEMGQQEVSKREYELLAQDLGGAGKALVLREPQLQAAKASCASARAALKAGEGAVKAAQATQAAAEVALEGAKLDRVRTTVKAPFNATVKERMVNKGSQISTGSMLGSLVGADRYWVQVLVPLSQLKWVRVPGTNSDTGSTVRVYQEAVWGPGVSRSGTVERLMADLEPQGRMARLLVAIDDPLGLKLAPEMRLPLVLGTYVRVEIIGRELPNIVRLDRTALRDGSRVWVMGKDGKLEIRDVTIAWSGARHVCVSEGLNDGDKVVTSDLGAPVPGMALRTGDAKPPKDVDDKNKPGRGSEKPE